MTFNSGLSQKCVLKCPTTKSELKTKTFGTKDKSF